MAYGSHMARLCWAGVLCVSTLPETVEAQASIPEKNDGSAVGDIVVTAQRRSERLLSVPVSVAVVDAARLANSGAVSTRNLGEIASGLTSTTNGFAFQPAIRGITTTGTGAGDESNIAVYIDGVYMAAQAGNFFNLKNVERIEVLKGPQGTLFGRNATGGAIRIKTLDPSTTDSVFKIDANYGFRLNSVDLSSYMSVPLGERLAIGVTANYYNDGGYVRSLIPTWNRGKLAKTKNHLVRGKLMWTPTDDLKFVVEGDVGYSLSDTQFVLTPVNGISAYRNTTGAIIPTGPYTFSGNLRPDFRVRSGGGSLSASWDLQKVVLNSVTARRRVRSYGAFDGDRTNLPLSIGTVSNDFDWFTQELTFTSEFDGPLNAVGGVYYFHGNSAVPNSEAFQNQPLDSSGYATSFGQLASATKGYVKSDSVAAFGEATWVVSDHVSLIAGARYTTEKKRLRTEAIVPVPKEITDDKRWSNFNYRITGQYKFDDSTNIYFTYNTGFKAGQYQATSATVLQRVDPETVSAEEIGLKSRLNSWLSGTVAAYHYKYKNIQLQSNNFVNNNRILILSNAAEATVYGVDADIFARLARGLTIQAGISYLPRARYDRYENALDSVPKGYPGSLNPSLCPSSPQCGLGNDQIIRTLIDSRMIRAPKISGNIGSTYETKLGGGSFRLSGNLFFTSRFFWVAGEHVAQNKYVLVNGHVSWTEPSGRYTISVFGRNLGNRIYSIYTSPNASGVSTAYAPPREFGVGLGLNL